eukprot:1160486-Pelagomonas_calceolata.AAC.2
MPDKAFAKSTRLEQAERSPKPAALSKLRSTQNHSNVREKVTVLTVPFKSKPHIVPSAFESEVMHASSIHAIIHTCKGSPHSNGNLAERLPQDAKVIHNDSMVQKGLMTRNVTETL